MSIRISVEDCNNCNFLIHKDLNVHDLSNAVERIFKHTLDKRYTSSSMNFQQFVVSFVREFKFGMKDYEIVDDSLITEAMAHYVLHKDGSIALHSI
jgi:hypothetical protein